MYKLINRTTKEEVKAGDRLMLIGTSTEVTIVAAIPPDARNIALNETGLVLCDIGADPLNSTMVTPHRIGADWAEMAEVAGSIALGARLAAIVEKIDRREAKWAKVVEGMATRVELALGQGDAELAEAFTFAKLYAEGQRATLTDVVGMF